ncbi:MAG: hypothetical protein R2862_04120 [Thermoanaerobaculia bacterium]
MIEKSYTTYTGEGTVSLSSGPGGIYVSVKRTDLEPHEEVAIELSVENLRELAAAAAELLAQVEPPMGAAVEPPTDPEPEAPTGEIN